MMRLGLNEYQVLVLLQPMNRKPDLTHELLKNLSRCVDLTYRYQELRQLLNLLLRHVLVQRMQRQQPSLC